MAQREEARSSLLFRPAAFESLAPELLQVYSKACGTTGAALLSPRRAKAAAAAEQPAAAEMLQGEELQAAVPGTPRSPADLQEEGGGAAETRGMPSTSGPSPGAMSFGGDAGERVPGGLDLGGCVVGAGWPQQLRYKNSRE